MSAVIKAQTGGSVRPFLDPLTGGEQVRDAEGRAPSRPDPIALLTRENEVLEARVSELTAAIEEARAEGHRLGRSEAAAEAKRDEEARIALLESAIASALAQWDERLQSLESLAVLLGKTALSKMFAAPEIQSQLVVQCIARQLQALRRETIVAITVSSTDFPEEARLAEIAVEAGDASIPVAASATLPAGECRIDLQIGHIDVGPQTQWRRLDALLRDLAFGEAPA